MTQLYNGSFYTRQSGGTAVSADLIAALVVEALQPKSLIDVGCGSGMWLKAFESHGVQRCVGVDGAWALPTLPKQFHADFLSRNLEHPLEIAERFDLAVSLEVAEHLQTSVAASFIESLVSLSPMVLFSAAIPGQGGVNHLNEQWPDYWAGLFARHGYELIDCIRPAVWADDRIVYYYAQNCFLFARDSSVAQRFQLNPSRELPLRAVHPNHLRQKADLLNDPRRLAVIGFRSLFTASLYALRNAVRRRVEWLSQ